MMKSILFLTLFITVVTNALGQDDMQQNDTLDVKVQLITNLDSIQLPAYCGMVAWTMTFEFKIIEVLEGVYSDRTIGINIQCPRETVQNKWLETGGEYRYRLVKRQGVKETRIGEKLVDQEFDDYKIVF